MDKCKIRIEAAHTDEKDVVGLCVKMDVRNASMQDKFAILHTLANALDLDPTDLMVYCMTEQLGMYEGKRISMPLMEDL